MKLYVFCIFFHFCTFAAIHGSDDRVEEQDQRVGVMTSHSCSAFLISNKCVISAGHCYRTYSQVFNFDGILTTGTSIGFMNDRNNDWSVYVLPKKINLRHFDLQQAEIQYPTVKVIGFPKENQNSMSGIGEILDIKTDRILHDADTTEGQSGSPLIDHKSGLVIGVHTHGNEKYNEGTAITEPSFRSSIEVCMSL